MTNPNIQLKLNWNAVQASVKTTLSDTGRSSQELKIIAVTKMQPSSILVDALNVGIDTFGENYALEMQQKYLDLSALGLKATWHFIGHLQTNKVKLIAPFVTMIHSVDSLKLAREISKCAVQNNRRIAILIQVNTSGEDSKSGCSPDDVMSIAKEIMELQAIDLCGLMIIPSFTASEAQLRSEFSQLRQIRDELVAMFINSSIHHLSMGMSGDFEIAISEGATMVRIGTSIFGERINSTLL